MILESLGSTELVFILVMALVFFGPRKLPQISRSLGKNLAEFRRASEDFKRTWDKEVTLEDTSALTGQSSILAPEVSTSPLQAPNISTITPDQVIARHSNSPALDISSDTTDLASNRSELESLTDEPHHSPKNDWL
ncbi:MAG TPA: twin-arginine translocase TatA/TatE family subunit [Pyrinomonadaceae bacterium]|jgi:TatA/E family protein of Tat protein translocase|nr:twin-arginine translocase TatA/TatE family subunit [Pyrinomonadaceae bacterium]